MADGYTTNLNLLKQDTTQHAYVSVINGNLDILDTAVSGKANAQDATLTGLPIAPTPTAGDNTNQIATTAFVQTEIDTALGAILNASY